MYTFNIDLQFAKYNRREQRETKFLDKQNNRKSIIKLNPYTLESLEHFKLFSILSQLCPRASCRCSLKYNFGLNLL